MKRYYIIELDTEKLYTRNLPGFLTIDGCLDDKSFVEINQMQYDLLMKGLRN